MRNSAVRKSSPLQEEGGGLHLKEKKKEKEGDNYYCHNDIREDADTNGLSPVHDCFSIMGKGGL